MPRLVIFTGQSGINVGGVLEKLSEHMRSNGVACQVLKVDSELCGEHLRRYGDDPQAPLIASDGGLQYLLAYPKDYIRDLWRTALDRTLAAIDLDVQFVLLTFHAISYHTISREFFSMVSPPYLTARVEAAELKADKVITFLDDIYDIVCRLRSSGQVFDLTSVGTGKAFADWLTAHFDLLRLFDWRAEEMLASEELARQLSANHFMLAVKHPASVASALISTTRSPVYLSHPISEIRRLQQQGLGEFADRAIDDIQSLSLRLVASRCVVPFLPTTIDEFRVQQQGSYWEPVLLTRWPYDQANSLHIPPVASPGSELDPLVAWPTLRKDGVSTSAVSASLDVMRDWVLAQISSRDRKLVEQSAALVVYRPYFNGFLSRGVTAEISHRNSLVEFGVSTNGERRCIVLSPPEDLMRFRVKRIVAEIAKQGLSYERESLSREMLGSIEGTLLETRPITTALAAGVAVGGEIADVLGRMRIVSKEVEDRFGALGGERQPMWRIENHRKWREIADEMADFDPIQELLQDGDVHTRENLTADEFVTLVERTLC